QTVPIAITLSQPAPAGGVTIALASGDPSVVTINPANLSIAAGSTTPAAQPQLIGLKAGSSAVSASATGYTGASGSVVVTGLRLILTGPASVTAGTGATFTLSLSG